MRFSVFILVYVVLNSFAFGQEPPQFFTLDGRLYDTGSPAEPLKDANVTMIIQLLNPAKSCVLYEEEQTVNTLLTDGYFNVRVGSPTVGPDAAKRSTNDNGNSLRVAFQNKNQIINGKTAGGAACTYTPAAGDERHFRFIVTPTTTGVTATLAPDMTIDSVPQAVIAETVQGLGPQDFIQVNANVTQVKADTIFGGSYTALSNLIAGTSTSYLHNNPNGTVIPVRATDPGGPSEGQLWFDSGTNQIKYYDGTAVQALGTSGGDPTKLPLDGSVPMAGDLDLGGNALLATGHITMSPLSTITIGKYDNTDQATLVGGMNAANKGATWFNSDTNKLMFWDGAGAKIVNDMIVGSATGQLFTVDQVPNCLASQKLQMSAGPMYAWSCVTDADSGDITAVNTNAPLSGGNTTGAITLSINYDNTTVGINGSNQLEVKDGGIGNVKISDVAVNKITSAATQYFTYQPNGAQCADNQVLKWDDTNDRWICANDVDTNTDAVASVHGRTGAVVSANGDYNAGQVTNTAAGNVAAVTVQNALNELDTEKVSKSGDTMGGALNMGGYDIAAIGNMTMNALSKITVGKFTAAEQTTLVGTLGAGDKGAMWFNTTLNKMIVWDGSAPQELSDAASAGGDITAVTANAPLTGGGGSGAVSIGLAYDNTSIGINGSNQIEVRANGITDVKIADVGVDKITSAATKYFKYMPNNVECANGGVLKWNNTADQWECGTDTDTNTDAVASVFGRSGAVTATAGDYNAALITNTPAGTIAATNVQSAINELASEKMGIDAVAQCGVGEKLQMGAGPLYPWSCVAEATPAVMADADNNTKIQVEETANEDKIRFDTGGTERMVIDNSGNIGIGTTSPQKLLHLEAATTPELRISHTTTTSYGDLALYEGSTAQGFLQSVGSTFATTDRQNDVELFSMLADISFWPGNAQTVTFKSGGNVGIGSTNPSAKLHVEGAANAVFGMHVLNTDDTGNAARALITIGTSSSGSNYGLLAHHNNGFTASGASLPNQTALHGSDTNGLLLNAQSGNMTFATGNTERMRLQGSYLGIGTATPRAVLDVNGTIAGKAAVSNGTSTIDFSTGNKQFTTANCGAFQFHNMKDGADYMFVVQGGTTATCSFTAYSDAGTTGLTVHLPPDHGFTTSGKHTIYNMSVLGTHVYISWTPGY